MDRIPHQGLKKLREICGFTQQELAKEVAVSKAAIVSIEIGRMPMSRQMAARISKMTGCSFASLLDPQSVPRRLSAPRPGAEFTREDFEKYRAGSRKEVGADDLRSYFATLGILAKAAGAKGRYEIIQSLFFHWAARMVFEFDLGFNVRDVGLKLDPAEFATNGPYLDDMVIMLIEAASGHATTDAERRYWDSVALSAYEAYAERDPDYETFAQELREKRNRIQPASRASPKRRKRK